MSKQGVDYKQEYLQLRANYMRALDLAFRTGYEKGMGDGQQQAQQQAMAMQQQMVQSQQQAQQQGPGAQAQAQPQDAGSFQAQPDQPELDAQDQGGGSDLDAQIAELKQALGKAEEQHRDVLQKSLDALVIAKKHSDSFIFNTDDNGKKALSMQERIVDGILKKWEDEESKTSNVLSTIISTEALTKKE